MKQSANESRIPTFVLSLPQRKEFYLFPSIYQQKSIAYPKKFLLLDDVIEIMPEISSSATKLVAAYKDINKYDVKRIGHYLRDHEDIVKANTENTEAFFAKLLEKLRGLNQHIAVKTIKEEILRIFVVQVQYISQQLIKCLGSGGKADFESFSKKFEVIY